MSSLFYIWDAGQHHPDATIETLEQAEYYATNSQSTGFTDKLKNWLLDVESIVTNPELTENFDEEIIKTFSNVKGYFNFSKNIFSIDNGLLAGSKYLYKVLIETLRQHDLVAFDSGSYIFFSRNKIFPDQQNIERMLDAVKPITKEELEQFKAVPQTQEKLSIFADEWLEKNRATLHFYKAQKKNQFNSLKSGLYRDINPEIYESINILCVNDRYTLAYREIALTSYIQLRPKAILQITRRHYVNDYIFQYLPDIHGIEGNAIHFNQPEQLKSVLQQIHDFLIYAESQHKDIETLNQWLNYGDEKYYIKGGSVLHRLILAKYLGDPLYDRLVEDALPYVKMDKYFKDITVEKADAEVQRRLDELLSR